MSLFGRSQQETVDHDRYASDVIAALLDDFPDLLDPAIAGMVRKAVLANARTQSGLEVILDDPRRANWKLVAAAGDRSRVHVGCWRLNLTDADRERKERLNAVLDAISTTKEPT
jgi:hypothetical protein